MSLQSFHTVVADLPEVGGPAGWVVLRRLAAARPEGYQRRGPKLERRFEEILERAGEAPFERQVDLGDDEGWIGRVDFADRRLKVIVEVQGQTFHTSLSDRRRDAERFRRLRAAGWIVVEVAEDEIFRKPEARSRAGALGPGLRPNPGRLSRHQVPGAGRARLGGPGPVVTAGGGSRSNPQ